MSRGLRGASGTLCICCPGAVPPRTLTSVWCDPESFSVGIVLGGAYTAIGEWGCPNICDTNAIIKSFIFPNWQVLYVASCGTLCSR